MRYKQTYDKYDLRFSVVLRVQTRSNIIVKIFSTSQIKQRVECFVPRIRILTALLLLSNEYQPKPPQPLPRPQTSSIISHNDWRWCLSSYDQAIRQQAPQIRKPLQMVSYWLYGGIRENPCNQYHTQGPERIYTARITSRQHDRPWRSFQFRSGNRRSPPFFFFCC